MATTTDDMLLEAALDYAGRGWCVLPLAPRGKNPLQQEWQHKASNDAEVVSGWWEGEFCGCNVGLLLGPRSGVIDLECDDEAAEKALLELFGENMLIAPTYQAARGKHRLFAWHDAFKNSKAVIKHKGIEIRLGTDAKGAQSVMPPSTHPNGSPYRWLVSPDDCDPPELPGSVLWTLLANTPDKTSSAGSKALSERHKLYRAEAVPEGSRDNAIYAEACAMWREAVDAYGEQALDDLERQKTIYRRLEAMNSRRCKPPLDDAVVLQKLEGARGFIRSQLDEEDKQRGAAFVANGLEHRDGEWWPGQWRIEVQDSTPPIVSLYAPFLKTPVQMEVQEFDDPRKVHLAVLSATGTVCLYDRPTTWPQIWNGRIGKDKKPLPGVKSRLLEAAQKVAAPPETKRQCLLAERLLMDLRKKKPLTTDDLRVADGSITCLQDGTYLLRFGLWLDELFPNPHKFTKRDLSEVLTSIGAQDEKRKIVGRTVRFKAITKACVERLEEIAWG